MIGSSSSRTITAVTKVSAAAPKIAAAQESSLPLRTLLIATTLFAVVLGLIVWSVR